MTCSGCNHQCFRTARLLLLLIHEVSDYFQPFGKSFRKKLMFLRYSKSYFSFVITTFIDSTVCERRGNFSFVFFLAMWWWAVLEEITMYASAYFYGERRTAMIAEQSKRNQHKCIGKCNSSNPGLEHCKTQMVNQRWIRIFSKSYLIILCKFACHSLFHSIIYE